MKFLTEYRNPELVKFYLNEIEKIVTKPWNIMEICGGQTHSLVKNGLYLEILIHYIQMYLEEEKMIMQKKLKLNK